MNRRTIAEQIFLAGVESVSPGRLISREMVVIDGMLYLGKQKFSLDLIDNIYVIGAGNSSARMAAEAEIILGTRITGGHIVVRNGFSCKLKYVKVTETGNNLTDSNWHKATKALLRFANIANTSDLVICLLSDGASGLLADFPEGLSPEDIISVHNLLLNSGACIAETNAVIKHLSIIKGGQLARAVYPATLVSIIISDVPGDQPEEIASGPAAPDTTTFQNAIAVLERFNLTMSVPEGILEFLKEGERGKRPETPKPGDPVFDRAYYVLAGNNAMALEEAKHKAEGLSLNPSILNNRLQGDIYTVAEYIVETAIKIQNDKREVKPVCLLFGGEVTFAMTGKGAGGRNQHLALLSAVLLQNHPGITILSACTDGNDGPTDAAGAVVDSGTMDESMLKNVDPEKYVKTFDSFHFFRKIEGHIITGPTMTNVGDIIVVIIE